MSRLHIAIFFIYGNSKTMDNKERSGKGQVPSIDKVLLLHLCGFVQSNERMSFNDAVKEP